MSLLVSWQLMLLLCAFPFRETLEQGARAENPGSPGPQLGPAALSAAWEPSPRGAAPESATGSRWPALRAPRSRLIPSPWRAGLVQREKDLPAYNWNSFGLRYGRRRAAPRD